MGGAQAGLFKKKRPKRNTRVFFKKHTQKPTKETTLSFSFEKSTKK